MAKAWPLPAGVEENVVGYPALLRRHAQDSSSAGNLAGVRVLTITAKPLLRSLELYGSRPRALRTIQLRLPTGWGPCSDLAMNSLSIFSRGSADESQTHERVLALVDPEPLPRECLAEVLQAAFSRTLVVAAAEIGEIDPTVSTPIALGLVKVPGPYAPGAVGASVRAFGQHLPGTPIIVMGCGSECFALEAVHAGARGVLPVSDPLRVAMAAVGLVLAGGTYYPLRLPREALSGAETGADGQCSSPTPLPPPLALGPNCGASPFADRPGDSDQTALFTARELDVLAALQRGRSNKWIASQLNLSENTVKVHIRHIMRKLKATNRTQAVIYSRERAPFAPRPDHPLAPSEDGAPRS
jgi:two-component system, NarL family, nitrate/nitrite response regulator NarL